MTAILTTRAKVFDAEQILASITSGSTKHYLFIGKTLPWSNDNAPDTPVDSRYVQLQARRDMLAVKLIQSSDASLAIANKAWASGKFYDMYRHDYDGTVAGVDLTTGSATTPDTLFDANFYVVTTDFNIYKCIYNGGGVASTVMPTGTSTAQFTTSDGYIWKYMGSVPSSAATKFQTNNFSPVQRIGANPGSSDPYYNQYLVEQAAVDGALSFIKVVNQGSGYPMSSTTVAVTITGDGTGATALATTNSLGKVTSINITAAGSGYTWATATVGGGGSGCTSTAMIAPAGGHGYDITRELGAYYIVMDVQLSYDEGSGDFPVGNAFRRVGILKDPYLYGTTTIATGTTYRANPLLTFSATTGSYVVNEVITGGTSGATGVVVTYDSVNKQVRYYQTSSQGGTFQVGESVVGGTSAATGTVSTLGAPEIDHLSGDILYLEHRRPTVRDITQVEDLKIILEA
jgi:hypothetical protein